MFLLEHVRFQRLTQEDLARISQEKVIPDPRGVHLATLYTRSLIDTASVVVGNIVATDKLISLLSSFDGIHFQQMYKRCKRRKSVDREATYNELSTIRPYFDIITSGGKNVKM